MNSVADEQLRNQKYRVCNTLSATFISLRISLDIKEALVLGIK